MIIMTNQRRTPAPWAARAEKAEIAMLAVHVLRLAEQGDAAA